MANERPTRWQKAKDDWPGFEWRNLRVGVVGIALAVIALAVLGRPGKAVTEVLIVGGAGLLAAILYPLGQLAWAWLQAPMRLLTADVVAIRERLEQGAPAEPARPLNVRLRLLNFARQGRELLDYDPISGADFGAWSEAAGAFMAEHAEADAEEFLGGLPSTYDTIALRISVLEKAARRFPLPGA